MVLTFLQEEEGAMGVASKETENAETPKQPINGHRKVPRPHLRLAAEPESSFLLSTTRVHVDRTENS